jgi:hypothetical protein
VLRKGNHILPHSRLSTRCNEMLKCLSDKVRKLQNRLSSYVALLSSTKACGPLIMCGDNKGLWCLTPLMQKTFESPIKGYELMLRLVM